MSKGKKRSQSGATFLINGRKRLNYICFLATRQCFVAPALQYHQHKEDLTAAAPWHRRVEHRLLSSRARPWRAMHISTLLFREKCSLFPRQRSMVPRFIAVCSELRPGISHSNTFIPSDFISRIMSYKHTW